jgi:hypothetical protein
MDKKSFNKDLSSYLDAKSNGKPLKNNSPILKKKLNLNPMRFVRSIVRKIRWTIRRIKAFIRGDHTINLSGLGRDIFVIKYEDTPIGKFTIALKKKFTKKKKEVEPQDIDITKVQETIRNNPLK